MAYHTNPQTAAYDPAEVLPQHLDHKPVYALPYQAFDGPYAGPATDMRYISVGLAQWDRDEVSVKTMRHVGAKWTRQAEEIPPHRAIDMVLFLAKTIFGAPGGAVTLPAGTLENQKSEITVLQEQQRGFGEMASYRAAVATIEPNLKRRFNALLSVLQDLKSQGRI